MKVLEDNPRILDPSKPANPSAIGQILVVRLRYLRGSPRLRRIIDRAPLNTITEAPCRSVSSFLGSRRGTTSRWHLQVDPRARVQAPAGAEDYPLAEERRQLWVTWPEVDFALATQILVFPVNASKPWRANATP